MKIFIFLLCSSFCLISVNNENKFTKFIEFEHIGAEDKHILPLIISTQKVDIPLSADEINIVKVGLKGKRMTGEEKALFQKQVITDKISYRILKKFIVNSTLFQAKRSSFLEYGTFKVDDENQVMY